ncbi:NADH:flavin oxidoreductase/NADH oxidase [Aureobasidium pullulans]|uniref:NADH:flavin oxidoreductase/NADH oxidase n=1 Tax=Aureobasidium pullulans TaxID=5580 RepID=A0A4T0ER72_AURPU|nr:NADH:flavin oxidoreductase/NADH oxidase [Aureobasidium pullulans]THX27266.1 NADH:flavin oxidoreductase/NADH oxidase [Aureobasidium pullulans]THX35203.1 NADH:flavin oxidoreductase/NADH oxidase [Aureobasidium pullulans]TIA77250.1 NADH:flavin oxidoreductase/NADH oxidase [Aureobasidium pullulans]
MILVENPAASDTPYYTPSQCPVAGTAVAGRVEAPKLFKPLQIKQLKLQNRILYSAKDGHHTDWHFAHLGGIISRGPGMSFVEATAVVAEGRITPEDSGLWKDSQIAPLRRIVEFAHSQGQLVGIQLAHAGRKASTYAPYLMSNRDNMLISVQVHGWPENVFAPSARPFKDNSIVPRDMTQIDIFVLVDAWISAVKRAVIAGFDAALTIVQAIEIHAGHGYLLHEFWSPVSNRRNNSYGGSFENRIRLLLEITRATKANIPSSVPLFVRVSGTDWLEYLKDEPSWDVPQTIELAKILADEGVDVLDVSSGGNDPRHKIESGPGYQAPFALAVKRALGDRLLVATVGSITSGGQANTLLDQGLDMVMIGRTFLKNPGLVWAFAEDLKVEASMPKQIRWAFGSH